jgi:dCTP deaminase
VSVLCDWQIRSLCEGGGLIVPFDEELLNPASIDVLLGDNLMIESPVDMTMQLHNLQGYTAQDPYWLRPGEFVLAETRETFDIPEHISGQFALKSSRAREGYSHMLAGWIDPGWHGSKLTLELQNARKMHSLPLYPGLKIGQIIFFEMSEKPLKSYAEVGHYNNDTKVSASKVNP